MGTDISGTKAYRRFRQFLSNIYLYGFLSRDDFVNLGTSGPDEYDTCTKLLRTALPAIESGAVRQDKKKFLRFDRQYLASSERQLADSYLLHIIKDTELVNYLWILSVVSKNSKTQTQIHEGICRQLNGEEAYEVNPSTTNRWIQELYQYGLLQKSGKQYSLAQNRLKSLTANELQQLHDYISFCCEITHPRVAGSFLLRCVRRDLLAKGVPMRSVLPVLLRHNRCSNIMDEDILYQLRDAIAKKSYVGCQINGRTKQILPIKLRVEARLGRWYLLYWEGAPRIARLSNIEDLTITRTHAVDCSDWDAVAKAVNEAFLSSGCSGNRSNRGPYLVKVRLLFGNNIGIMKQFRREMQMGRIISDGDGLLYVVKINDPVELVPFLRQYAPWIQILPGGHGLDQRIKADLLKMRQQLEGNA